MRVAATIRREEDAFVATCQESSVVGEGKTRAEALESLREGLKQQLRPEAIAPPPGTEDPSVEIVVLDEPAAPIAPRGPGEAQT